ncbi:MAG: TAXI family TRAP transporter solute-binding subunit [Pseudolabrys sp.]
MLRKTLRRWHLVVAAAIAALLFLCVFVLFPASSEVTLATAFKGTGFYYFGQVYRDALAKQKLHLNLRESIGGVENLRLLEDPSSGVQAGFALGGVSNGEKAPDLYSLGTIYDVGLWIFYVAPKRIDDLSEFRGKRIALGPKGSGIRIAGEKVFGSVGIDSDAAQFSELGGDAAFDALRKGTLDAVWTPFPPDAPMVKRALAIPNVQLFSFKNADAYTRLYPEFAKIVLPRGVLNLATDQPPQDTTILASRVRVLVRKDIRPEFVMALLFTMAKVHGHPGVAQQAGEFPNASDPEYPVLPTAIEFYKNGPSFLYNHVPIWLVPHAQRAALLLATIIPLLFLILNGEPQVYRWIIREKLRPLYRRMREIERELRDAKTAEEVAALRRELEAIDDRSMKLNIPNRYSDSFFAFLIHVNVLRTRIAAKKAELEA